MGCVHGTLFRQVVKLVIQVYDTTVPLEWEVTILYQLQCRLQKTDLQELVSNKRSCVSK